MLITYFENLGFTQEVLRQQVLHGELGIGIEGILPFPPRSGRPGPSLVPAGHGGGGRQRLLDPHRFDVRLDPEP
jgi:hypothetical protein